MARHDVAVEHVEVGALGDRQHARIEPLGERRRREVVLDGLGGATQEDGGGPRPREACLQRRRVDALGRTVDELRTSTRPTRRRRSIHEVDRRPERDRPEAVERRLAAVLAHVHAGRRDDCEQRARSRHGRKRPPHPSGVARRISNRPSRRRGAPRARRRRPVRPAGACARARAAPTGPRAPNAGPRDSW